MRKNLRGMKGGENREYVATFINPVDHRLYDIVSNSDDVYVLAPMPSEAYKDPEASFFNYGNGSYDEYDEFEGPEGGTYYRSHTPSGVYAKKQGLGLMLYSGLALNVVRQAEKDGIFSELKDRSGAATEWWEAQVQRGFADQTGDWKPHSDQVDVHIDEDWIDKCELSPEDCEADIDSIQPDYVTVYVDFIKERIVQILPAVKVAESEFVVAWDETDEKFNDFMEQEVIEVPNEVLAEVDMSTTKDPGLLLNILERLEKDEAIETHQLQRLVDTFPGPLKGADSQVLRQRIPFEEIEESAERAEKQMVANPKRRHSAAWKKHFGKLAVPI